MKLWHTCVHFRSLGAHMLLLPELPQLCYNSVCSPKLVPLDSSIPYAHASNILPLSHTYLSMPSLDLNWSLCIHNWDRQRQTFWKIGDMKCILFLPPFFSLINGLEMPLTFLPGGKFHRTGQPVSLSGNCLDDIAYWGFPFSPHPSLLLSGTALHYRERRRI